MPLGSMSQKNDIENLNAQWGYFTYFTRKLKKKPALIDYGTPSSVWRSHWQQVNVTVSVWKVEQKTFQTMQLKLLPN